MYQTHMSHIGHGSNTYGPTNTEQKGGKKARTERELAPRHRIVTAPHVDHSSSRAVSGRAQVAMSLIRLGSEEVHQRLGAPPPPGPRAIGVASIHVGSTPGLGLCHHQVKSLGLLSVRIDSCMFLRLRISDA